MRRSNQLNYPDILVAGAGIAPASQGYGPRMVLLHYPAVAGRSRFCGQARLKLQPVKASGEGLAWTIVRFTIPENLNQIKVMLSTNLAGLSLDEVKVSKGSLVDFKSPLCFL